MMKELNRNVYFDQYSNTPIQTFQILCYVFDLRVVSDLFVRLTRVESDLLNNF